MIALLFDVVGLFAKPQPDHPAPAIAAAVRLFDPLLGDAPPSSEVGGERCCRVVVVAIHVFLSAGGVRFSRVLARRSDEF